LGCFPGFVVYLSWMNELDQYGYVLPLLLSLIALVLFRWDYRLRMPTRALSYGFLAASLVTGLFAGYRASPWFSAIAIAFASLAWLSSHESSDQPKQRLTYLGVLLLMLIRLPLNLDVWLASGLQRLTSRISSSVLDALDITHYLRGNVIELPGGTLFVEEACSGVQSLFTVLFLACLWVAFRKRPLAAVPAYLAAGIAWAMVMNVIRIVTVSIAQEWYASDLSSGTPHEILGWICLAIAILMMMSTDRLLRVIFYPVPPDEAGQLGNPAARCWNYAVSFGVPQDQASEDVEDVLPSNESALAGSVPKALVTACVLSCLISVSLSYQVVVGRFGEIANAADRSLLWEPDADLLATTAYAPAVSDYQVLRGANSKQLGHHADVWTVVVDGMLVRVAISQPYPEWHDMRWCYTGDGWQVNQWNAALESAGASETDWIISRAELIRENGQFGTLLFSGMNSDGDPLEPPMIGLSSMLGNRIKDRQSLASQTIMLQLWTESASPLSMKQFDRLVEFFGAFRTRAKNNLTGHATLEMPTRSVTLVEERGILR
ncbi:MAG: exosortase U, partial [Planctomycetota bacterium]